MALTREKEKAARAKRNLQRQLLRSPVKKFEIDEVMNQAVAKRD